MRDTIVILEEGSRPYPWCPKRDIFVSHKALNSWLLAKVFFHGGEERKWRRLVEEEARVGEDMKITAYGIPLAPFTSFNYLGRISSEL